MKDDRSLGSAEESQTDLEPPVSPSAAGAVLPPLERGTVLAGRYEIRKVIGRGGMGLVVEALDRILGEAIAIKILRAEYAGERTWAERLAREVKLARQIHHPNVCRVFDFAQADGRVFLTMELTSRGSLRDEINSGATATRPLADRIADVRALAAGLGAIHAAGIVHRDVSPQNVLRMPDGRAVLSDFGLATDSFESTTNVGGGTIAYMAPELIRSGRASVASDVWALGVVSHEIVFGERPHWRPGAHEMSSPNPGRRLAPGERAVLEICRACTAADPERRPGKVAELAARLTDVGMRRSAWRRRAARAAAVVCVGAALVGVVGGVRRARARRAAGVVAAVAVIDPLLIVPTGVPDDWTDKSKVLAEVPEKIRCMSLLSDHRTVRFVWGHPSHAEDVDTHTGNRRPSPLVPEAYAEGCPDVSPDGRRMVYTGHTPDGRAFAFLSSHAEGSGGVPVVPIAEPSMNSDPTWLLDGETFSYDADLHNMAVFSLVTNRSMILPRTSSTASTTRFRHVLHGQILTTTLGEPFGSEIVGWRWPSLAEEVRVRYPGALLDVQSRGDQGYYCSVEGSDEQTPMVEIDPVGRVAQLVGFVRRQHLRYPNLAEDGLSFVSTSRMISLTTRDAGGHWQPIVSDPTLWAGGSCGHDIVAARIIGTSSSIVRLDRRGHVVGQMSPGPRDVSPVCSSDGSLLFYAEFNSNYGLNATIKRCDADGCRTFLENGGADLVMSSDDKRLAFVSFDNRGPFVRWMSTSGGEAHDLAETETVCSPEWSSDRTLWVSRRRGKKALWVEMDVETRNPTGKVVFGTKDCTDGEADPASPALPSVKSTVAYRTQLRLLASRYLPTR